ncbi:hypothetical protein N8I77_011898 [Diaporthe amygdali]|uniref:Aminoglycoside phosphotransferase domain-containing protein n=1 Tax=Phomopsis amygdali TaxID=1214568 RepID=A0AAD9VXW3_PHOAM|nr:hypothetical protein N8I77_011898 [Diaporthe amygdali]
MDSLFESGQNAQDAEVQKAHELANTITIGHLTRKLQADPSADLSSILNQQASLYPELRESLAQEARERTATLIPGKEKASDAEPQDVLIESAVKIAHPLSKELVAFAGLEGTVSDDELISAITPKLHQLMRTGDVLFSLHDTSVLSLGASEVLKTGTCLNPEGITNLQFINTHFPQIPSPKFLGSLQSEERAYIFMSRGEGETLESLWPQLSVADKRSVQKQLSDIFHVLRTAPSDANGHSPTKIGGFASGVCQDMRRWLRKSEDLVSEAQFNDFLCCHQDSRRTQTPWIKMIRSFMKDDHKLVMTHGDLHPRNIMVKWVHPEAAQHQPLEGEENAYGMRRQCIKVTSILDWEMAGWYPEYWEFVKALNTADVRGPLADWSDYLPTEAIGQWPLEYSLDLLISRWLG